MRIVYGRLPFELRIVELDPAQAVERDGYRVAAVPVRHGPREAYGYALVEDERPGEFDPGAAEQLGVSPGPDFGRLQQGQTVEGVAPEQVMGPPRQGRKLVFSGDTAPCETLAVAAHQADVLVHEATFTGEEAERALETFHSTARQAAELARGARPPRCRGTSTRSRCPSPSVGPPSSCAGAPVRDAAAPTRASPTRPPRPSPRRPRRSLRPDTFCALL